MEHEGPYKREAGGQVREESRGRARVSAGSDSAALLALEPWQGALSREIPRPPEAGKEKEMDSPLEPPEGTQTCVPAL